MVTWANDHYFDFVLNWVLHLRRLNVTNHLVGAMDDKLLQRLIAAKLGEGGSPPPLPSLAEVTDVFERLYQGDGTAAAPGLKATEAALVSLDTLQVRWTMGWRKGGRPRSSPWTRCRLCGAAPLRPQCITTPPPPPLPACASTAAAARSPGRPRDRDGPAAQGCVVVAAAAAPCPALAFCPTAPVTARRRRRTHLPPSPPPALPPPPQMP